METFVPPIGPSPGTGMKPTFKILEAEFGDGYSQPTPNGINHRRETLSLSWTTLTEAQMKSIRDFLRARGGTEPFLYQPAGEDAAMRWTCKEYDFSLDGAWRGSAILVQSFSSAA